MPLDLTYWLDDDDIDVILAAHRIKPRNAPVGISNGGRVCVSRPLNVKDTLAALASKDSDLGKYLAEGDSERAIYVPIISGSHVIMMSLMVSKSDILEESREDDEDPPLEETTRIDCEVVFYDPHGFEAKKYPDDVKRSELLESLTHNFGEGKELKLRNKTAN